MEGGQELIGKLRSGEAPAVVNDRREGRTLLRRAIEVGMNAQTSALVSDLLQPEAPIGPRGVVLRAGRVSLDALQRLVFGYGEDFPLDDRRGERRLRKDREGEGHENEMHEEEYGGPPARVPTSR